MYNEDNQIRFKTAMLRSNLYDYSDAYTLVKGTITVENTSAQSQRNNATNKNVIFKICAPFTNWISRINETQIDDVYDTNVVTSMYNLIEYSNNYSKTSGILLQYYKDVPAVNNDGAIIDFNIDNAITRS